MHIDEQTKLVIGVLFAVIGIVMLFASRGTRGFGQRKQAGVLLLVAAALFIAIGLGHDPRALFRQ
jgi:drug/metabolite transporter (DMT)-like permease